MKRCMLVTLAFAMAITSYAQQNDLTITWPSEGYHTPGNQYLLPLNTEVHFGALPASATGWRWELPGATPEVVEEQEAAVVYAEEGVYDVRLEANVNGVDKALGFDNVIQAGNANFVWNIASEEVERLETIALAWYGYYGGTNWLGMEKFAEAFHDPMQTAYIDSVAVRFGAVDVATEGAEITLSVNAVEENGMPGEPLGVTSLLASQVNRTAGENTFFRFAEAVRVDGPFFVVIGGFPKANGDGLAIECVRRPVGEECTAYHLLADEDVYYQPTGTYTWYQNVDDPTSFAICPWLRYATSTGTTDRWLAEDSAARFDGHTLYLPTNISRLEIFGVDGRKVLSIDHPSISVSLESLSHGIYLIHADGMIMKVRK